jgi:lysyl-tRNA synthetase class 2
MLNHFRNLNACAKAKKREDLIVRAHIIQTIRRFFMDNDYIEIETPIRIPAPAPEAHIDAIVAGDWFLQTSPELCMKRLLAAGFPRIFQICKCFRHGERGRLHLPEMTMLEWYRIDCSYLNIMKECEVFMGAISQEINSENFLICQGTRKDLTPPWHRISVAEAFEKWGVRGTDMKICIQFFITLKCIKSCPSLT